jgi:hypothetical protein
VDVHELQGQPAAIHPLDIEPGGQVAGFAVQGDPLVVDHAEVAGRVQAIQVRPVHLDVPFDVLPTLTPGRACKELTANRRPSGSGSGQP